MDQAEDTYSFPISLLSNCCCLFSFIYPPPPPKKELSRVSCFCITGYILFLSFKTLLCWMTYYRCVFLNRALVCCKKKKKKKKHGVCDTRSLGPNQIIRAGQIVLGIRSISWHVFFSWRINQKSASLWMAERVCLIPLSSQKIENGTFAWEDKRWCQSSRAGFRRGGKTQILNFSRWWLPAVTACLFTGVPIRDGEEDQLPGSVAGGFEFPANPIRRRAAWGYLLAWARRRAVLIEYDSGKNTATFVHENAVVELLWLTCR